MFKLEIDTDNAAFEDPSEVPRMLREAALKIEQGKTSGKLRDLNGNICGYWEH